MLIIFLFVTIVCYSENCANFEDFFYLVQYIFTCVFLFCFHACYFCICDCNTLGGNLIQYMSTYIIVQARLFENVTEGEKRWREKERE